MEHRPRVLLLLTLTLVVNVYANGAGYPCPYEVCTCNSSLIDCSYKGLTALPVLKNGSFPQTTLDFRNNNITYMSGGHIPPGLESFICYNNPLTHVTDDAFNASAATLTSLDISANALFVIPPAVSTLPHLSHLDLSSNYIVDINTVTFPSSLQTLLLSINKIENIPLITFTHSESNLTELFLDFNPLSHISTDAFSQLSRLSRLVLSYNRLTRLPLAMVTLTRLTRLDLYKNPALTCTCYEAGLAPWYRAVTSLTINGDCEIGTSRGSVVYFLTQIAPKCS